MRLALRPNRTPLAFVRTRPPDTVIINLPCGVVADLIDLYPQFYFNSLSAHLHAAVDGPTEEHTLH